MGRPRSNNLQVHLNWALSTDACRPQFSFLDSPEFRNSVNESRGNEPIRDHTINAMTNGLHNDELSNGSMPPAFQPSIHQNIHHSSSSDMLIGKQSNTLPTPPSNTTDAITVDSESDSDLEFIATLSKPSMNEPKKPTQSTTDRKLDKSPFEHIDYGGKASPAEQHNDNIHIIETSSNPNSPPRMNQSQNTNLLTTPKFRFTQAPPSADSEPPKQELGSVFSEKIALLEQKVKLLTVELSSRGIRCDTRQIDDKIREVDRRIEQFPDNADNVYDAFDLNSSPQAAMQAAAGLPFNINNDQFDSEINADNPIGANHNRDLETTRPGDPFYYDDYYSQNDDNIAVAPADINDDDDDDDEIEILEYNNKMREVRSKEEDPLNSLGDDQSLYNNRLNDDSMIIATESLPPPSTQFQTQGYMQPQTQQSQAQFVIPTTNQPWTKEMMHILRTRFGLQGFRPNQAEAVNETLSGNDVVVLMPTGGGKSLCYQLPALVTSGSTQGTTVVISPLISLMQDQVYHLKNRNIQAEMLNSKLSASERSAVFNLLNNRDLQLLYISPEMLSISTAMRSALQRLYLENQLARIVIDEAHCVSAWGHDFRPEYMELTKVKNEFPATPIMALTATANERVLLDIVGCLRSNPIVLKQSFNRRNLFYEVRPKTGNVISEIASVCGTYYGKSGIIYCHSKRNCEETATKLRRMGIKAEYYHAGMSQEDRASVQQTWQQGKCTVVCATIAFGMGIDKPDVRYVMHMTIPRNIEGYYQETGRAGRDGKLSQCILFYNYRDVQLLQKMIQQDTQLSHQVREHHRTLLIRVMQYCENKTDCRRQQVLQYFNEDFNPKMCHRQCDNCRNMQDRGIVRRDMSSEAKLVVDIVNQIAAQHITTQQITDVLLGRRTQKAKSCGFDKMPWFGKINNLGPLLVERLVHALVSERVIEEYSQYNHSRFPQSYIRLGPKATAVGKGQMPIHLSMPRESELGNNSTSTSSYGQKESGKKKRANNSSGFRYSKRTRK